MSFAEDYRNTIMWELDGAVDQFNRTQIAPSRMAFLVNEQEWDALAKCINRLRRYQSEDDIDDVPITKIEYRGIEVRKR